MNLQNSQFQKLKIYQQALDEAVIFAITDSNGKIIYSNKRFTEVSGYSEKELLGRTFKLIDSNYFDSRFWKNIDNELTAGNVWKGRLKYRKKNGKSYWVKTAIVPLISMPGEKPSEFFHIQKDITELVRKEQNRVNDIIYQHEKNYEEISDNLREGIAQSMAGLSFHLTAMESQFNKGKEIQQDSISALKEILKSLLEDTNDLAFDIMPRSLMREGIHDALHSFFNRLTKDYEVQIDFNDTELKCFPIAKSAEIQVYRTIVAVYEKAIERSNQLNSTFKLLNSPQVGFKLSIEQNAIEDLNIAEKITATINSIIKQVNIIDGEIEVHYYNDKRSFDLQVILPKEYTQETAPSEIIAN